MNYRWWKFEISMYEKTVKKATILNFNVQIPFFFLQMDLILHWAYFCWTNMQGSSDLSVLTPTGVQQAEKCRRALANINFDRCFASPISRAKVERDPYIYICTYMCYFFFHYNYCFIKLQLFPWVQSTAEVLWQGREEELVFLDSLKEAHLFFLEGMKNGLSPAWAY